ncbi:hypothetical protein HJFPF1_08808 [Paramyrothecium foliicola]|nr:hypothetical protein HJFPF1_08808 [Paramyrothecium foliicola]
MTLLRSGLSFRILLGVLAIVTVVWFRGGFSGSVDLASSMMESRNTASLVDGLAVALKQSDTSPPTITVTVTNKNPEAVTFVSYESPLDPIAFQLGLLSITPAGKSEPLDYPTIQARRRWPPTAEELISIAPGDSKESQIVIRENIVPKEDLGSKASVQLKGTWMKVWAQAKSESVISSLENGSSSPDVFSGTYESDALIVNIG